MTGDYRKALQYYQQAMQALVKDFEENSVYVSPKLKVIYQPGKAPKMEGVQSMLILLTTLERRAEAFYGRWMMENGK